jgi:phenylalanyl-tRNA synthetase beta chain
LKEDDKRRKAVKLLNPLSAEESVLRTSLLPGLICAIVYNLNRFQGDLRLFEIGRVFISNGGDDLPEEPCELAGAYAPSGGKPLYNPEAHPFHVVKGAIEELMNALKLRAEWKPADHAAYLLPGEAASIHVEGEQVGFVGCVRPSVAKRFGVDDPLYVFEVDFMRIQGLFSDEIRFKPLPAHPPAFRDIAIIVPYELPVVEIERAIRRVDESVSDLRLFDVYRGEPVPEGNKSVAFSITYRFENRSPLDEEVNSIHNRVAETLKKEFGAQIR